jgi:alpha-tubulin suppressor-like RCC1 family protein
VECWGLNSDGQLGDGTTIDRNEPVSVIGLSNGVTTLAAGASHTCALLNSGVVKCWGLNTNGQLGDGTKINRRIPVQVQKLTKEVKQLATGTNYSCALTLGGKIYCWGDGSNNIFGDKVPTSTGVPVEIVMTGEEIVAISAGQYHLCVITGSKEVKCWGALSSDQEFTNQDPLIINSLPDILDMVSGGGYTCVLTKQSGVKCWGDNYFGQLGNGTYFGSWTPVDVHGLNEGAERITAGFGHACALTLDGGVRCWGDGSAGQLGDSSLRWK